MTLSSLTHNHIINESPLYWHLFQFLPTPPPSVQPCPLPLLLIYLVPNFPEYLLFFPAMNFNGVIFPTKIGLSTSKLSFVNRTTGRWSAPYFSYDKCSSKVNYSDALSTLLSLHYYIDFLYCGIIPHAHIILSGRCHITFFYCNNLSRHLCTTWVTLASDSSNFWSPLKSDITVNSATHK